MRFQALIILSSRGISKAIIGMAARTIITSNSVSLQLRLKSTQGLQVEYSVGFPLHARFSPSGLSSGSNFALRGLHAFQSSLNLMGQSQIEFRVIWKTTSSNDARNGISNQIQLRIMHGQCSCYLWHWILGDCLGARLS